NWDKYYGMGINYIMLPYVVQAFCQVLATELLLPECQVSGCVANACVSVITFLNYPVFIKCIVL
ncbi:hypothetical protein ACQP3L_39470, partial [Escherichia coli]